MMMLPGESKKRLAVVVCFLLMTFPTICPSQESREKLEFLYGERLFKEGLFDLASIQFLRYIGDYPSSPRAPQAQWMAAESDLRSMKYEEARREYLRYVLDYPASPDADLAQLKMGECFEKEGQSEAAAQSYVRLYSMYPQSGRAAEGLYRTAVLYFGMDSLARAESTLRILLDLKSSPEITSKTTFLFADLFNRREKFEQAVKLLTPFLNRPAGDPDRVRAQFKLGRIMEAVGDWKKAMEHYQAAVLASTPDSTSQSALLRLGLLNVMLDAPAEAAGNFRQCVALNGKTFTAYQADYRLGKLEIAGGRFQDALNVFLQIDPDVPEPVRSETLFEKAACLEALGKSAEAAPLYGALLTVPSVPLRKKSMLALAETDCRGGDSDSAFRLYDRYASEFPDDPNADRVCLRKAQIAFDSLGRAEDGFGSLMELWKRFPGSALVPEAQFRYAGRLEECGRKAEAAAFYNRIMGQYPFSDWAERADQRMESLEWNDAGTDASVSRGLSDIMTFLDGNFEGPQKNYRLGMFAFRTLKQYGASVVYLKRWLSGGDESVSADSALLTIAESYRRLCLLENRPAFADSSNRFFSILLGRFPGGPFAANARIRVMLHALESGPEAAVGIPALESVPADTGAGSDRLLLRLARAAFRRDSLQFAMACLNRMGRDFPRGLRSSQALFLKAVLEYRKGRWDSADSLFLECRDRIQNPSAKSDVDWYRGWIQRRKGNASEAVKDFEAALTGCPVSIPPDSLVFNLGDAYQETGGFEKAATLFENALRTDSARAEAVRFGLAPDFHSLKKPLLLRLAKAYSAQNEYPGAKRTLILYARENQEPAGRFLVWSSLSKLAEKEGNHDQARFFLEKIIETDPSDSAYAQLGLMSFSQGRYDEAIPALTRAAETALPGGARASLQSKIIGAMFRLDRITEAESRIKPFESQFKTLPGYREFLCEIELERGKAHARTKSYESALKSLKTVQDYKKSPLVPEADLETGRVLLLMNKTEKGMELLADLVKKYPNHPILPRVYLNLGDQYYRSNQIDNALSAFKVAAADSTHPDVASTAVRYLIKIYEGLQMTDAAMALTRTYLRRYPDAEDALQKKIQIGIYYYDLKEYDRAIDRFRNLKTEADPESEAEIQYWIGKCYADKGQYETAALEYLKVKYLSAPTQLPWATTALYEAGVAYLRLHQAANAKKMFEKIVTTEGATSDLGRIARQRIADIDQGKSEASL
jgi:tetratricopeptide (TPR) repeat protein